MRCELRPTSRTGSAVPNAGRTRSGATWCTEAPHPSPSGRTSSAAGLVLLLAAVDRLRVFGRVRSAHHVGALVGGVRARLNSVRVNTAEFRLAGALSAPTGAWSAGW